MHNKRSYSRIKEVHFAFASVRAKVYLGTVAITKNFIDEKDVN